MRIKFVQKFIDKLRKKSKNLKRFNLVSEFNDIRINPENIENIFLDVVGKGNVVHIDTKLKEHARVNIHIFGDNNRVIIKEGFGLGNVLNIYIGQDHKNFGKVKNSTFEIGENSSVESMNYFTYNSNTYCKIGKDCMISSNVTIYNTDAHPIFDVNTGKILNKVDGITIGEHCWIGMNAVILKNSILPDNSILGLNAVFRGGGNLSSYCAFAGNPARLVKENVTWDQNGSNCGYVDGDIVSLKDISYDNRIGGRKI